jgi:hypothetical protein
LLIIRGAHQYLMEEMDSQQVLLKHLEVQEHFAAIDFLQ